MKQVAAIVGVLLVAEIARPQNAPPDSALLTQYCAGCHNERLRTAGLMLDKLDLTHPGQDPEAWEKVVRKLRAGMMPPAGMPRPDRKTLDTWTAKLETELDLAAAARPNPGNTGLHRLNRTEYANAIRDLLAIEVDASTVLPADDSSEGFDNIADALAVSPALIERYVAAAGKISRLAVGNLLITPSTVTYRAPADLSQTEHIDGLPLGTRGGMLVRHTFPLDAEYSFKVRARSAGIGVGGVGPSGEELEFVLNGERVKLAAGSAIDAKVAVKAGPQDVGAAYVRKSPPGADDIWQTPGNSSVSSIAITGPLNPTGPGDTPSRRKIFVCRPASESEESACAKKILSTLALRAYRQPPSGADLDTLLSFYHPAGRRALSTWASSRHWHGCWWIHGSFSVSSASHGVPAGSVYRVSDLELASRLSFFLWSSIPDEELLNAAIQGNLHDPAVLEKQTLRMLKDPRSETLATNFGGQWLYLRELKSARPEARGFNDNLRQAFRRETELLLESILREDRNVVDLLNADYTFVNEALARHYGIPGVKGSRFKRVTLQDENRRGLLGQSSFLLVTSVANRTSPVSRGKWVLENLLGTPAPLPPPNVPPLPESEGAQQPTSIRQKMEEHRANPVCAACHKIMDPIGFSLENFDLIGKWRATDGAAQIDASGQLVDGTRLNGPASLRQALLSRSDVFVRTMTEKLLTYATGRAMKSYDMPVVRSITREAARNDNRFSSLILGIVKSDPFQMRVRAGGN